MTSSNRIQLLDSIIYSTLALYVILGMISVSTATEKYPFVVSLRRNGQHICAGVIISTRHVITVEKCIQMLAGGSDDLKLFLHIPNVTVVPSSRRFGDNSWSYPVRELRQKDGIGFLLIKKYFHFNTDFGCAKLSLLDIFFHSPEEQPIVYLGFSELLVPASKYSHSDQENGLIEFPAEIVDKEKCLQNWSTKKLIPKSSFCFKIKSKVKGPCQATIGSPLVLARDKKLMGLVSDCQRIGIKMKPILALDLAGCGNLISRMLRNYLESETGVEISQCFKA